MKAKLSKQAWGTRGSWVFRTVKLEGLILQVTCHAGKQGLSEQSLGSVHFLSLASFRGTEEFLAIIMTLPLGEIKANPGKSAYL